ncbi:hypothetical protein niasHT_002278 [Heterodera trifolii]|uniref:BPL/LPL catalytic domain-containing protein n=1 Tax=Heterodera trifolii TaxID=157864 RepID=A0ABD2LPB4_9BILA
MLFLAWSLFHFAVRFGRRHRLIASLNEFFSASAPAIVRQRRHESLRNDRFGRPIFGRNASSQYQSICCRSKRTFSPCQKTFHIANTTIKRVPSEPTLYTKNSYKNVRKIYSDEQREIVVFDGEEEKQSSFCSSERSEPTLRYANFQLNSVQIDANCVCFSAKTSSIVPPSHLSTRQMHSNCNFLDSFALFIAHHRTNPSLRLYTAPISTFFDLVFRWSEGTLFERETDKQIEEIRTFPLPFASDCPPKRRLCASLPSRPPSLLELMFLQESTSAEEKMKVLKKGKRRFGGNNWGRERPFSRFSTTSLPMGDLPVPMLPNYLKRMRRRKCKSGGSEIPSNSEIATDPFLDPTSSSLSDVSTSSILTNGEIDVTLPARDLFRHVLEKVPFQHSLVRPLLVNFSAIECLPPFDVIKAQTNPNITLKGETPTVNCSPLQMNSKTLKFSSLGHSQLSRSTSLLPSSPVCSLRASADAMRRRSLSPLTLSLLVNYGGHEHSLGVGPVAPAAAALFTADPHFPGKLPHRRAQSVPRRSFVSVFSCNGNCSDDAKRQSDKSSDGAVSDATSHGKHSPFSGGNRPRQKPPSLMVYCGDDKVLFDGIRAALRRIVPTDTYTVSALSTKALLAHPWMDSCACLIIADTSRLDSASWSRLQIYFVNSGKILFVCENSLLASLTSSSSQREQSTLLKNAFGNKTVTATMGKEFGNFLKRSLKGLAKNGQVNETFYARDAVGDTRFSVVLHKKKDQPLLLYMQNLGQRASALFSDATTEQLLSAGDGALVRDALHRLGLKDIPQKALPSDEIGLLPLSSGYLVAAKDLAILDIPGMTYGKVLGCAGPSLIFHRSDHQQSLNQNNNNDNLNVPPVAVLSPSDQLLPVEVRRRRDGLPETTQQHRFEVELFFQQLATKRLGQVLLYVPVCRTTMEVAKSLSHAFPLFDGILVVAGIQLAGKGRAGNDWISPAGCASFSFNFNIPCDSNLGRSICFLQHITAVSVASAVSKLLKDEIPDFPIRLKWPNDIYYERSYKLGGLIVQVSHCGPNYCCTVGVGLNVANAKPTICINDMLPMHSNRQLTVEEVLAWTMNEFEYFVNVFEKKGRAEFLKSYYRFWMHSHEEVQILHSENGGRREKVVIRGLDEYGYLEVRSKETGQIMNVMDDGNTFDLFHGLIVPK